MIVGVRRKGRDRDMGGDCSGLGEESDVARQDEIRRNEGAGFNIQDRTTEVVVVSEASTETSNRPWKTPFNLFVGEEDMIKAVLSQPCPPRKRMTTSPRRASYLGSQNFSHLRQRATIVKIKDYVKGACKMIKKDRRPSAAEADT